MYHRYTTFIQRFDKMKIALASDHAGYEEKERLKPVDYPDYAQRVGEEVAQGRVDQGLLVCGSGTGMAIAANKIPGVHAAVAWNGETARLAREHNDANVLSLGARVTPAEQLPGIMRAWLAAKFAGGRHTQRVEEIREIEQEELGCGAPH
jgi:ribose 5-phosphate isomerase B